MYQATLDLQWGQRHPRPAPLSCVMHKTTRSPINVEWMLEEAAQTDEAAAAILRALRAYPGEHPGFFFGPLSFAEVK